MTYNERLEGIKHCTYVDEIVENAPWSFGDEFVKQYMIDYVAHDDAPYVWNTKQKYEGKGDIQSHDDDIKKRKYNDGKVSNGGSERDLCKDSDKSYDVSNKERVLCEGDSKSNISGGTNDNTRKDQEGKTKDECEEHHSKEENKSSKINEQKNDMFVDPNDVYYYVKSNNMFIPTLRAVNISTSDIITRIVKDYDAFVRRNLERGISAKDLNIGIIDENIIKVKSKMIHEYDTAKNEIKIALKFWEDKSKEFVKIYEERVLQRIKDAFNGNEHEQNGIIRACKKVVDTVKKRRNE